MNGKYFDGALPKYVGENIVIYEDSDQAFVYVEPGLYIIYHNVNLEFKIMSTLHGSVIGMNGNANGDPKDDLIGADGLNYGANTLEEFAETWKVVGRYVILYLSRRLSKYIYHMY